MADLTNAQKAQILVDGAPVTEGASSTANVIVADAPLVVTLGTPEPK